MQLFNRTSANTNSAAAKPTAKKFSVKAIVTIAILIALGVVLSMSFPYGFTLRIGENLKFTLSFIVVALAARKYGTLAAVIVATLSDLIQALLGGMGINPFITASAAIGGLIFGLILKKDITMPKILLAVGLKSIICTFTIMTAIFVLIFGKPFPLAAAERAIQTVFMAVVETVILYLMFCKTDWLKKIGFID